MQKQLQTAYGIQLRSLLTMDRRRQDGAAARLGFALPTARHERSCTSNGIRRRFRSQARIEVSLALPMPMMRYSYANPTFESGRSATPPPFYRFDIRDFLLTCTAK